MSVCVCVTSVVCWRGSLYCGEAPTSTTRFCVVEPLPLSIAYPTGQNLEHLQLSVQHQSAMRERKRERERECMLCPNNFHLFGFWFDDLFDFLPTPGK